MNPNVSEHKRTVAEKNIELGAGKLGIFNEGAERSRRLAEILSADFLSAKLLP
jgi:hypothetical protein